MPPPNRKHEPRSPNLEKKGYIPDWGKKSRENIPKSGGETNRHFVPFPFVMKLQERDPFAFC